MKTTTPYSQSSSSSSTSSSPSSSLHSTISTHSLTSSTNSTSSSSSRNTSSPRCHGLDLLVKAVSHVSFGSSIAFPYIQRRVIRRRKPASKFSQFILTSHLRDPPQVIDHHTNGDDDEINCSSGKKIILVVDDKIKKQKRRSGAKLSKCNHSVFQSIKPKDRKKRRSSKV